MRTVTIWQIDNQQYPLFFSEMLLAFDSGTRTELASTGFQSGYYAEMCKIDAPDGASPEEILEKAFRLTQNGVISDSWTLSPPDGVTPLRPPVEINGRVYGHRSTSIGDILQLDDGTLHIVDNFGFQEISPAPESTVEGSSPL